jgi:hypothetical protein
MHGQRYWVENGELSELIADAPEISPQEQRKKFNAGHVRLTTGELGTEIKWSVLSPCLASLFFINDWLTVATGPFVLRFYASGWFEEFHETYKDVNRRLDEIIVRGDRHFTTRTLIKEFSIKKTELTPLLNDCISQTSTAQEYAVECVYEDNTQQFLVQSIGPKSAISRVYGSFLSSFPCQTAGSYGQSVSEAYKQVLNSGKPRYDHVLAAMRMPDNEVFWVPYRRLVLPKLAMGGKHSVLVVSEITSVDIQLI